MHPRLMSKLRARLGDVPVGKSARTLEVRPMRQQGRDDHVFDAGATHRIAGVPIRQETEGVMLIDCAPCQLRAWKP